jgi:DNA-binding CsgD family transcriptional regulator/DNA polymerase III delta prime subunit
MAETPREVGTDLLGRDAEVERLGRFVETTSRREPGALLLEGEPGIGKTTIWREGMRLFGVAGHRILSARPAESEASLSFAALGDLVGEALDEIRSHELPAQQRRALDAALLRGEPDDQAPDLRAVSVALLGIVRSLASGGPVLVAVDDVQWMDPPTARALGFAARRLEREPVAFLAATLPPAVDHPFDLPADRIERIQLGPLGEDALRSLLRSRLDADLAPATVRQIHQLSGGNPFFAIEMARATLRGEPAVTGQRIPIPKNLREDLLRHRFAGLSEPAREVVLVCAAASHPTVDLVSATEVVTDGTAGIAEAISAGLLERSGGELWFAHPFYRSAVYADESRERRHALHRALADVVTDPEERVRHLALGADEPDSAAADALDDASRVAIERGAPESAAELAELAARLTPPDERDAANRRRTDAARDHASLGDTERAITLLEQVASEAPAGSARAASLWHLGRMQAIAGDLPRAKDVLEQALAERGVDARLANDVRAELAITSWLIGDAGVAAMNADLALRSRPDVDQTAPAWPDADTGANAALALNARCRAIRAASEGDLATAENELDDSVAGYRATNMAFELGRSLLMLGAVRRRRKQKRPARESLTLALDEFERLGNGAWAESTTRELSGISGRRPSAGRLTPAEQRVARLAAAGRTNKEIADVLYMSVRTVEGHLSRIYSKLEIRSRVELALFPASAE